jgi:hypothetical protein
MLSFFLRHGKSLALSASVMVLTLASCTPTPGPVLPSVEIKDRSNVPTLVKALSGVSAQITTLISSSDTLSGSPDFVFGGMADGFGIIKNADSGYVMLTNHEDNFAVSRVYLDRTFKPTRGEYIMTSNEGLWRLCSATMATPEENGFGPTFLTCGESGFDSQTHQVNVLGPVRTSNRLATAFGFWSAENAVPLATDAVAGKTAVIIGDDDSGNDGGQVALYLGNGIGDLENGNLYVLARTDNNIKETDMRTGQSYTVEFRQITNAKTRMAAEFNSESTRLNSIKFGRVEDLDYRRGGGANSRELYFCVTGQDRTGNNADASRTMWGRVYRLTLDAADPLKGKLEVIFDGDDLTGPAKTFMNVDNICVTQNYVYIQEDPNRYRTATSFDYQRQNHDPYIYQWRIGSATSTLKPVIEADLKRGTALESRFIPAANPDGTALSTFIGTDGRKAIGDWEYGALKDISDLIGQPDTFILCVQSHTWREKRFQNPDKGTNTRATLPTNLGEGSQLVVIRGLPR